MDGMMRISTIRPMNIGDFDECITLAQDKYRAQHPRLDYNTTWEFLERASISSEFLLLRGRNVCFCAGATRSFMEPEIVVGALWIFTRKTDVKEFIGVIRIMEDWAKSLSAIEVGFGNISDKDFTAVASRLGYKPSAQYFTKGLVL